MISVYVFGLLVGLFLWQQDYTKTTEQILTTLGGEIGHGPRKDPLNFGQIWRKEWFDIFTIFPGNNERILIK